jgi:hypothetical protein
MSLEETEINEALAEIQRDPRAALDRLPPKQHLRGAAAPALFSADDVAQGRHIEGRDLLRQRHTMLDNGVVIRLAEVLPGRAPYEQHDRAENLVDRLEHRDLRAMEAAGLREASLDESPWSDDYWGIYRGVLGCRYADPRFPSDADWAKNHAYVRDRPALEIAATGDQDAIDRLAPAEKYDLLVGDPQGTLTARMWQEGRAYYERDGKVERWMGICHGWAPAAYMLPRPRRALTVLAADGHTHLRFYPSDIKGLASLLWANTSAVSRFIGGRCNDKDPARDEIGRMSSSRCFDTNPGTWHLAIVNQIGAARRSFVLDATFDYEVWNQPAHAYSYRTFNPLEYRYASDLSRAIVPIDQFPPERDRFRRYRGANVAAIVGVVMEVDYVVETAPSHDTEDDPSRDGITRVRYIYDLELDPAGAILGGEWYQNRHPDFLWTPPPGARARTAADAYATGDWLEGQVIPGTWRSAALRAAEAYGGAAPLARIVERLIELARA